MNRYGRMAQEHHRRSLPTTYAAMPDPEAFFAEAGREIEASIGEVRDQLVGLRAPGVTVEDHERRRSRAWATAEELVLADHHLLVAEPETEVPPETGDDPELAAYHRDLAEVNEAITRLHE